MPITRPLTEQEQNQLIDFLAAENGWKVSRIKDHHLRIHRGDFYIVNRQKEIFTALDYFTKSGRATWVGSNKWFTIDDIESFLLNNL